MPPAELFVRRGSNLYLPNAVKHRVRQPDWVLRVRTRVPIVKQAVFWCYQGRPTRKLLRLIYCCTRKWRWFRCWVRTDIRKSIAP